MLTAVSHQGQYDCQGTCRRDFLKIGSLGAGSLTLSSLLAARGYAAQTGHVVKNRSVVFLFLCGGASQYETFDPNMLAPQGIRSANGQLQTALPGVTFGGTFPNLARHADKLAVVRSFAPHSIGDHPTAIATLFAGGTKTGASIGASYTRLRGSSNPVTGMPTFAELIAEEPDLEYQADSERMQRGNGPGSFGPAFAPFSPTGDGQLNRNMVANLPLGRLDRRLALLRSLDKIRRRVDDSGMMNALDQFQQQAVDLILGKTVRQALDLSLEDPRVVEKYDTSRFQIGFHKKRASDLGQRLLLARRLCEAGCGFVTVGSAGWDHHANDRHSGMVDGMEKLGRPLDQSVAAFLEDVEERGLSDDILLVILTEFGRTPKINKRGGRGHWPQVCPLVFAGGGLKMGQVVGETTPDGGLPNADPLGFEHLWGTLWHALFDLGQLRVQQGLPGELKTVIERASPISELI